MKFADEIYSKKLIISKEAQYLFFLAIDEAKKLNYNAAIELFNSSISLEPMFADAYYQRAHCKRDLDFLKFENQFEIISDFKKACDIDPDFGYAWHYLGVMFSDKNKDISINYFVKAKEVFLSQGNYLNAKKEEEAIVRLGVFHGLCDVNNETKRNSEKPKGDKQNIFSKVLSFFKRGNISEQQSSNLVEKSINKDNTVSIEQINKNEVVNFEGKGSNNKLIEEIYLEHHNRLLEWRKRYSAKEYPQKVVQNVIYQSLILEDFWDNIIKCFNENKGRFKTYSDAYNELIVLKNYSASTIHPKVDTSFANRDKIGTIDIQNLKLILNRANSGNNEELSKIEKTYLWYSAGAELMYHWAANGLIDFSYEAAAQNVCSLVYQNADFKSMANMQVMFGNNINMEYKKLPDFYSDELNHVELNAEKRKSKAQNIDINSESKICEYCGVMSDNYVEAIVFIPSLKINLKSQHIKNHDATKKTYTLLDGNTIQYDILVGHNEAYHVSIYQPHIFCSDICQFNFKNKHKDVHLQYTMNLSIDYVSGSGNYSPKLINAGKIIDKMNKSCSHCSKKTSEHSSPFQSFKIINKHFIEQPQIQQLDDYSSPFLFPYDSNKFIIYSIQEQNMDDLNFCSLDCAYKFINDKDELLVFEYFFDEYYIGFITPDMIQINKNLNKNYILTPLKQYHDESQKCLNGDLSLIPNSIIYRNSIFINYLKTKFNHLFKYLKDDYDINVYKFGYEMLKDKDKYKFPNEPDYCFSYKDNKMLIHYSPIVSIEMDDINPHKDFILLLWIAVQVDQYDIVIDEFSNRVMDDDDLKEILEEYVNAMIYDSQFIIENGIKYKKFIWVESGKFSLHTK